MKVIEREFSEYDIDDDLWRAPKPFGISGCFRLRDEAQFMELSILSHLPYLDECVLVVQPSKDDTLGIAEALAEEYDKVKVFYYPHDVRFIDHPEWHNTPESSIYSFVYLSNWALTRCTYSWIAKTEGDVICLPPFERIINNIKQYPDSDRYYGRVILNVAGEHQDMVSLENVRNGGLDEAVFPNHPDYHFFYNGKWESVRIHNATCWGWSALHMKRCKREFLPGPWNGEHYLPWTRENVRQACEAYNSGRGAYPGNDDDPLGQSDYLHMGVPCIS